MKVLRRSHIPQVVKLFVEVLVAFYRCQMTTHLLVYHQQLRSFPGNNVLVVRNVVKETDLLQRLDQANTHILKNGSITSLDVPDKYPIPKQTPLSNMHWVLLKFYD